MKKFIVFLNGKHTKTVLRLKTQDVVFPFFNKKREYHHNSTLIFAADNGFKRIIKEKIRYSKLFLFGDFDSLSPSYFKKSKQDKNITINVLPKQKSLSDFACILDYIQSNFSHQDPFFIEIYGGLGNDKDHEYANLKEAELFLGSSKHGGLIVFQGSVILSTLPFALPHIRKKNFSVFAPPSLSFDIHNALYSGNILLTRPSHGLSNTITKSPLIIERQPSLDIMTMFVRED